MKSVHVTQGHEKGIGLEVFFKSLYFLSPKQISCLVLHADKKSVEENLQNLRLDFEISSNKLRINHLSLNVNWIKNKLGTQSLTSLHSALEDIEKKNAVLFTLPTSKDQLKGYLGHTELLRDHFKNPDLGMYFYNQQSQILLLTDHLSLENLLALVSKDFIVDRLVCSFASLQKWKRPIDDIFISGLNPHAGEGGLLGEEDLYIHQALSSPKLKEFKIAGPYSGDTLTFQAKSSKDLLIYLYHDQGLAPFKATNGLIGVNMTLGLPFPRLSPDHGTAFQLYGKNLADYRGCLYSLREALTFVTG